MNFEEAKKMVENMDDVLRQIHIADRLWARMICERVMQRIENAERNVILEDLVDEMIKEIATIGDEEFSLSKEEIEAICFEAMEEIYIPKEMRAVD